MDSVTCKEVIEFNLNYSLTSLTSSSVKSPVKVLRILFNISSSDMNLDQINHRQNQIGCKAPKQLPSLGNQSWWPMSSLWEILRPNLFDQVELHRNKLPKKLTCTLLAILIICKPNISGIWIVSYLTVELSI